MCAQAAQGMHATPRLCVQESLADRADSSADITRSRSAETESESTQAPDGIRTASGTEVRQPLRDAAENGVRADNTLAAWPVSADTVECLLNLSALPNALYRADAGPSVAVLKYASSPLRLVVRIG